jgi:hypothetical protein
LHPVPASVTVIVWPATVNVPVRVVADVFPAMLNCTNPLPVPLAPTVTKSQLTLATAVQPQPLPAVTCNVSIAPVTGRI